MDNLQHTSEEELLTTQTPEGHVEEKEGNEFEERYKNLESTFTKANQEKIEFAKKLIEKDKSEILNIKDVKLQNKIIKDTYWYDNLAELQAIHWENFYNEEDKWDSDMDELKQKLKLMEYRTQKTEVDTAINSYIKDAWITDEDAMIKLSDEIKYISSELDIKERVQRAGKIAFPTKNKDAAYLAMQDKHIVTSKKEWKKGEIKSEEFSSALRHYFK